MINGCVPIRTHLLPRVEVITPTERRFCPLERLSSALAPSLSDGDLSPKHSYYR